MVSLDLSFNSLMLRKPNLEDVAERFTHLAELDLSGVDVSSPVPHSLSNLTSLSSLVLVNCLLLGEFPPSIFQLPNLRVLSLQYNQNLTGYLPEFDHVSSPLESLILDVTNFSGQLHVSIGNLKSLVVFTALRCCFRGVIPSSVGNLTNLDTLELHTNYFSGEIPLSLGNLFRLKYLSLSRNNFSSGTLHWLGKLTSLILLDLDQTNSNGAIPSSLHNMTQLQTLAIRNNQLTGQIPHWLGNLTLLRIISLESNLLQGGIPGSIFQLPNIQVVILFNNSLKGYLRFDSFLQSKNLVNFQIQTIVYPLLVAHISTLLIYLNFNS